MNEGTYSYAQQFELKIRNILLHLLHPNLNEKN